MATESKKSFTLSQIPYLTSANMTNAQYRKTVEDLSSDVFDLHTDLIVANDEIVRLSNLIIS